MKEHAASSGEKALKVNAATACLPGYNILEAVEMLSRGIEEPGIGSISADHLQLCPQNEGLVDDAMCDRLREAYPGTSFRLHANAKIWPRHVRFDASTFHDDAKRYFTDMASRSRRLGAPAYSLHAGFRKNCSLARMLDNVARIQDLFGDIPVAVEGLYRNAHAPQLMDCWDEYEAVMSAGVPIALDMSHLQIVATTEGQWQNDLVEELVASARTLEIHLSENDGTGDHHAIVREKPQWWDMLQKAGPHAVLFTEGNQVRAHRFPGKRCATLRSRNH